jgi:hypothetical protein
MSFTRSWDETTPADTDLARYGAQKIRELREDVRERFALEHMAGNATTDPFGMHKWSTRTVTTNYTLTNFDHNVFANGTLTITLPTAVGIAGKPFYIKNIGTGTVTVATSAGQTIDGQSSISLSSRYADVMVVSNGTNWSAVGSSVSAASSFRAYGSGTDQYITMNVSNKIYFNTVEWNNGGVFSDSTFTPNQAGVYTINVCLDLQFDYGDRYELILRKNGVNYTRVFCVPPYANRDSAQLHTLVQAAPGDRFEVYLFYSAVQNNNIYVKATQNSYFAGGRIG